MGEVPDVVVDYRVAGELKRQVSERLRYELRLRPDLVGAAREQRGRALINEAVALWADATAVERGRPVSSAEETALAEMIFAMQFRAGRLQRYLDDSRIENILINGHDQVWLDFGDSERVRAEPVADSEEDLRELLRDLARHSGQSERTLSTADPFLALRLADGSRLQAMTGVTGERTYVTIRRHRLKGTDLAGLVQLGTIDGRLQQFLSAAVRAERNIMVAGEQAAGKTFLLRALLSEIHPDERFGTIETEFELWAHEDGLHRQVVPMEARESNGERVDGRSAGEITLLDLLNRALRMTLTRVVVGEVRGSEITALMQALTSGRGGNLATVHAIGPHVVFDRIAELYLQARGNFSERLAYRQIANGLHLLVYVSLDDRTHLGGTRQRWVSHVWEITGLGPDGRPSYNELFGPAPDGSLRAVPRTPPSPQTLQRLERAGLPSHLLHEGVWATETVR
ncbi:CpaF family protein [Streptomyces kronopolitis]|uniref:CpaF family protein n=1 Tax=Streptomyces kronopolitis TaxID=1612435 RepID=UPI0036CC8F10